jgi:hypothetical protein
MVAAHTKDAQLESTWAVCTENVVARPDSAARAFVGAGGVSPAGPESLIAFHLGGKEEYGRRFFLPGADAPCARHDARLCHAPLPVTKMPLWQTCSYSCDPSVGELSAPKVRRSFQAVNKIVTRSMGLALNGSFCVDPAGRRRFSGPTAVFPDVEHERGLIVSSPLSAKRCYFPGAIGVNWSSS